MTRTISNELLSLKLNEALSAPLPARTPRDIRLPTIPGKALAIIGVRRGGKTSFMHSRMAARVAAGEERDTHLLLSLEDERLVDMTAEDLGWLLQEHLRHTPAVTARGTRAIYLDEVQLIPGWEVLVRRLLDTGGTEIFVSGSSAKLLSREVSTSLRGRAMEVLVHPFSFREALRHRGKEPSGPWRRVSQPERVSLDGELRTYLDAGGFPEAQQVERRDRIALLKSYVDVMVLRDVIERHDVSNPEALRRMQRHLLSNPGGTFSVSKFLNDLKSQGTAVAKDTLHEYLAHLEDAFLIRVVSLHSASEKRREVNPRKAYPIDTGLIPVYERSGRENRGRALETAVLLELERRGYSAGYVRVGDDLEVDFYAERPGDPPMLIQVSLDTTADATWEREVRSLTMAAADHPGARALLITLDPTPPSRALPAPLEWRSATQWLLKEEEEEDEG